MVIQGESKTVLIFQIGRFVKKIFKIKVGGISLDTLYFGTLGAVLIMTGQSPTPDLRQNSIFGKSESQSRVIINVSSQCHIRS